MENLRGIMRSHPLTIGPDQHLGVALQEMLHTGIRHLPVVKDHKLVGVLSQRDILRHRAENASLPLLMRDRVAVAMTHPPIYADVDESTTAAADRMCTHKIGCLPVLDRGDVVGIVTTTDILAAHVRSTMKETVRQKASLCARDIMTKDVVTVSGDSPVEEAVEVMAKRGLRHLPVVDGQRHFLGMLRDRDVRLPDRSGQSGLPSVRVSSLISTATTLPPDTPLSTLLPAFSDWRLDAAAVTTEDHVLVGIISYVDLLNALAHQAA